MPSPVQLAHVPVGRQDVGQRDGGAPGRRRGGRRRRSRCCSLGRPVRRQLVEGGVGLAVRRFDRRDHRVRVVDDAVAIGRPDLARPGSAAVVRPVAGGPLAREGVEEMQPASQRPLLAGRNTHDADRVRDRRGALVVAIQVDVDRRHVDGTGHQGKVSREVRFGAVQPRETVVYA